MSANILPGSSSTAAPVVTSGSPSARSITPARDVKWFLACRVEDIPPDGGACVSHGDDQIAIFHFSRRDQWYATQNLCPHKQQMALSRGMPGSAGEHCEPKVACPFHKKPFSLLTGNASTTSNTRSGPIR